MLPKDLDEALAALTGSAVFGKGFGDCFVDYFVHPKGAELVRLRSESTDNGHGTDVTAWSRTSISICFDATFLPRANEYEKTKRSRSALTSSPAITGEEENTIPFPRRSFSRPSFAHHAKNRPSPQIRSSSDDIRRWMAGFITIGAARSLD